MLDLPADLVPGSTLVAAVSGGADSIALLDLLVADGRFRIVAWHLDHGLRTESPADATLVAAMAARLGVAAVIERADVAALARAAGEGIEAAGRRERYARLAAVCTSGGAVAACTAHHRDDQAETVLLQILRGCGPEGPPGIPAERPLAAGLRLLRPLLAAPRTALREHCRNRGLAWREDPSNADTLLRRNFIRHAVLAGWEERFPGIAGDLAGLAVRSRSGRDAASRSADAVVLEAGHLDAAAALALPAAARGALWRRLLGLLGVEPDRGRLRRLDDLLAGPPDRRLRLGGWLLLRRARMLTWRHQPWVDGRV